MRTERLTSRGKVFLIAICAVAALIVMVCAPMLTVSAYYSGQSVDMTREELHSKTLALSVRSDTPAITVLMHGLGGDGGDWSNQMHWDSDNNWVGSSSFAYDSESIIEKMRNTSPSGISLYRAKSSSYKDDIQFTLCSEYSNEECPSINDFSLHTVIVVELNSWTEMENSYERLHYILDKISYDYYVVKGCLPRVNLVGHSMGGLFNMQYAIEHPKNVAALVSLATPYNGSWYDNILVDQFLDAFNDQPCISGTCGHSYYFCNLESRKKAWNDVYAQNKHIGFYALSGETSASLVDHIIWSNGYIERYKDKATAVTVRAVFANFIKLNLIGGILPGDVCVDTNSQKAVGYDGAINYNKVFTAFNSNVDKRSQDNFPVPHNLEAYDSDMHEVILKVIDYGVDNNKNVYSRNNMTLSIIAKTESKWLIKLTNNTGSKRSFDYNRTMCFEGDAQDWNGLAHIGCTDELADGGSTVIEIEEYGTATSITVSYADGNTRYIFYARNLDKSSCTMTCYGNTKASYSYTNNDKDIEVSIVSKGAGMWSIKLTNRATTWRTFDYNRNMCFESDAQNWTSLTDIAQTKELRPGESTVLEIYENGTATSFAVSYTRGATRYILYAKNLSKSGTMTCCDSEALYYVRREYGVAVSIIGKCEDKWLIKLTNEMYDTYSFDYNQYMCFEKDAKNWNGLSHVATTVKLRSGASVIIEIREYLTATSIALSYVEDSVRYIIYAKNLGKDGSMTCYTSSVPTYSYDKHGIRAGIVGKNSGEWSVQLTNATNSERRFYYNSKMCNAGDARDWTGLSDICQTETLAPDESVVIKIRENGTATSIAVSYINGGTRYIFYANNLKTAGTLSDYGNAVSYISETRNGMQVSIVGKNSGTWLIELTNRTGRAREFEYNRKLCFEGDAAKWNNLTHKSKITLANGETTKAPLQISEYGTATTIALSYKENNIYYVFYANNLSKSGSMKAYESTVNPNDTSGGECVAAGTLITLADGSQKPVEELTGTEMLLVWNMFTGAYDCAPILTVDSELIGHYDVIKLTFSDATTVDVISEHGFWDVDLNKYVYLDRNAARYIGHGFLKQNGDVMSEVTLTEVNVSTQVTTAYSPVTYGHLCYFVNGMLSMPGGIDGLFNIFETDGETMMYDTAAMRADIEEYGLFTYEELNALVPVSEEIFDAVNGKYLKVAIGKGIITVEQIRELVDRYGGLFE